MIKEVRIAVDLMGGDKAPIAVIEGIEIFNKSNANKNIHFFLVGDISLKQAIPQSILSKSTFIETTEVVKAEDKPAQVIRNKKTSMAKCISLVAEGTADVCMSAGNTGALMAMSKLYFGTIDGVDRPAICTIIPTLNEPSVLLDMGANLTCTSSNLVQFATMGSVFAGILFNISEPKIGIVNVGSEDNKGNDVIQNASDALKQSQFKDNFIGFIEGDEITKGRVNVVVTDGFTGNVVLKALEGSGRLMRHFLKDAFQASFFAKLGYLFAKSSLEKMKEKINPNNYNGALFLGLNKVAVKSHGGADKYGIANAIKVSCTLAEQEIVDKIKSKMQAS
jgi:glycerol-3-phosphate acyltransferase PlsX